VTVTVPAGAPRGPAAIAIVLADAWKRFLDDNGRQSFSIPASAPGRYYRATENGCTCAAQKYQPWQACKHVLAVQLQLELDKEVIAF